MTDTEKPIPCPFCGSNPRSLLSKVQGLYAQLPGEYLQRHIIQCPKGHAKVEGCTRELVLAEWNKLVPVDHFEHQEKGRK